jgi:Trypsin-like peptidase domain
MMAAEGATMRPVPMIRGLLLIFTLSAAPAFAQDKPDEMLNAVVGVSAKIQANARSAETLGLQRQGTGVLVRSGYALTIGYLVIEAESVQVTGADGRTLPATVAAYDHGSGFALLKIVGAMPAKPLPLGDSAALGERDPAMAVTAGARDSPTLVYVVSRRAFSGSWEYLLDSAIFTYPPVMEWSGAPLIGAKADRPVEAHPRGLDREGQAQRPCAPVAWNQCRRGEGAAVRRARLAGRAGVARGSQERRHRARSRRRGGDDPRRLLPQGMGAGRGGNRCAAQSAAGNAGKGRDGAIDRPYRVLPSVQDLLGSGTRR